MRRNEYGQPIGAEIPAWEARPWPPETPMVGRYCQVVRLDADLHAAPLFAAYSQATDARNWTYLLSDPPSDMESYWQWLATQAASVDPFFQVIESAPGSALGVASFLRIDPAHGVIEVGHINFSAQLQQTRLATEAMFLMMRRAFDELGYRRYEWKCDSLNEPSRRAALRFGFTFEGVFRQALIYKGRNRDTAWFSVLDTEWPRIRSGFQRWLDPANFDAQGRQIAGLQATIHDHIDKNGC